MRFKRRLYHNELEVVANLAGNMAGLRFLYVLKLVQNAKKRLHYMTNLKNKDYDKLLPKPYEILR